MIQLIRMAFRDLGRNRRRTFFSILALAIGLALLITMASFINGEMDNAMDTTIRLQSGHLQLRGQNYDERKSSLKWEDLIEDPTQVAGQIATLEPVVAASPRLYASGIVESRNQSAGVQIIGIDPGSLTNDPYREGLVSGEFLTADDREGILIGRPLAEKMGLSVGDQLTLTANTSNGDVSEQLFTIRGIYSTETSAFDNAIVFLPLAKAQAMTRTENHASTIFVLLKDKEQTDAVVNALQSSSLQDPDLDKDERSHHPDREFGQLVHVAVLPDRASGDGNGDCQYADHGGLRAHARDRDPFGYWHERPADHGDVPG